MPDSTQDAVLSLSSTITSDPRFADWSYRKAAKVFVFEPVSGVTATLALNWRFKNWRASCRPSIALTSDRVIEAHRAIFGSPPRNPQIKRYFQKIWRQMGDPKTEVTFVEDLANPKNHELLVDDLPKFLAALLLDCQTHFLSAYTFQSETRFLESLPAKFQYHGDPLQDEITYLIKELLVGKRDAVAKLREGGALPPLVAKRRQEEFAAIEAAEINIQV